MEVGSMPLSGLRLSALICSFILLATASNAAAAALDRSSFQWEDEYGSSEFREGQVLPGRLAIQFEPGYAPSPAMARADGSFVSGNFAFDQVASQVGLKDLERFFVELPMAARAMSSPERDSWYIVQFDPAESSVLAAAEAFARLDGVVSVQPDPVHAMDIALPNDPGMASQWWLRNTALGSADVRAVGAWNYTTGDPDVLVCVADSGVDWKHPDLGGTGPDYIDGVINTNMGEYGGLPGIDDDGNGFNDDIRGYDFVNGLNYSSTWQDPPQDIAIRDPDPMDYGGHGTAVSGCIAAISNNGIGISSINWNVRILPCRVGWTDNTGQGLIGMSFAAQGMDYARIMGADVFNSSWGSSAFGPLVTATNAAVAAGMVIVTSAGNSNNQDACYLCSRDDVVSVAATTSGDSKAGFSSYGTWVDISAPGQGIYTTAYNNNPDNGDQHIYTTIDGTSFSSPIVCGGFAMAKSYFPGDTRQQLVDRVLAATDNIDATTPGYVGQMGSGRLNLTKLFYDGSIWPVPEMMPELIDALQVAAATDTVAVEGGFVTNGPLLYSGNIETQIMGGFDATYSTRDPLGSPSVFQIPAGSGTVLRLAGGLSSAFVIDGFRISGGRVNSPSLAPDAGFYGGGIQIQNASPTLRNLIVSGNQAGFNSGDAGYGGGIAIITSSPVLENVEVTNNQGLSGAGIYIYDSTPTLTNLNVHSNTAWASGGSEIAYGGGVFVRESPPAGARRAGPMLIDGGSYSNNSTPGAGGGLYFMDCEVEIHDITLDNNSSIGVGAGIAADQGTIDIYNSVFTNNAITPSSNLTKGGGLYAANAAVNVDGSEFSGNSCTFAGGGLAINAPTSLSLTASTVVENTASIFGAGVYVENGTASMALTGNTVANNSGGSVGGDGFYVSGGSADFLSNVVAFNDGGASNANGIHVVSATATFSCNLVHGNTGANYGGVTDPTGSNDNIDTDPLFCDMAGGEYTLSASSPAAIATCGLMGAQAVDCGQGTGLGDDTPPVTAARRFALGQNRPNPFNPSTQISFSTPQAGHVTLRVFDIRGRLVRSLVDRDYAAGDWTVSWDGRDDSGRSVASGAYLYELRAQDRRQVRKMGLLK